METKQHVCVIPLDGEPQWASADTVESLKDIAYKMLIDTENGWCYFLIDGVRCHITSLEQVFSLRLPDGKLMELRPKVPISFDDSGKFTVLRP